MRRSNRFAQPARSKPDTPQKLATGVRTGPVRCAVDRSGEIAWPPCRKLPAASHAREPGRRASGPRSTRSGDGSEQNRSCASSAPRGSQDELPPPPGGGPVALGDAPDKHVGRGTPKGRPGTKLRQSVQLRGSVADIEDLSKLASERFGLPRISRFGAHEAAVVARKHGGLLTK